MIGIGGFRFLPAFSAIGLEDGFGADFPDPVRHAFAFVQFARRK